MNIVYFSSSCSDRKFAELQEKGMTRKLPQAQKYHRLMMEGLAQNIDGEIVSISAFPVNRQWTRKVFFERSEETVNQIQYIYNAFVNLPVLRQFTRYVGAMSEAKKVIEKGECVFICDVLNYSVARAARHVGKKRGIPVLGIVTDVPGYTSGARRKSDPLLRRIVAKCAAKKNQKDVVKFDGYLFLTEAMNSVVNLHNKPYIVLEGHADASMAKYINTLEGKQYPKVMMYAGGIHKEFGIEQLVEAFIQGEYADWEFHIYGDGNYQNQLRKLSQSYPNIKYFGQQPNALITERQLQASLLVNPRLTNAEYVKYSFPSKNLECMISGTPLLTTRLPGMPNQYNEFVYLFDGEQTQDFSATLNRVLNINEQDMFLKGRSAKDFALKEKNNIIQAKKLCDYINRELLN